MDVYRDYIESQGGAVEHTDCSCQRDYTKAYHFIILGKPYHFPARTVTDRTTLAHAEKKREWQQNLKEQHYDGNLIDGPVVVKVDFYFKMPATLSARRIDEFKNKPYDQSPDLALLVAFVKEMATGILFKNTDAIVAVEAKKHYGESQRTELFVMKIKK